MGRLKNHLLSDTAGKLAIGFTVLAFIWAASIAYVMQWNGQAHRKLFIDLMTVSDTSTVILDHDGQVLGCSKHFEEEFGWSCDTLKQKGIEDIIPPEMRHLHQTHMARALDNGHLTNGSQVQLVKCHILTPHGGEVPVVVQIRMTSGLIWAIIDRADDVETVDVTSPEPTKAGSLPFDVSVAALNEAFLILENEQDVSNRSKWFGSGEESYCSGDRPCRGQQYSGAYEIAGQAIARGCSPQISRSVQLAGQSRPAEHEQSESKPLDKPGRSAGGYFPPPPHWPPPPPPFHCEGGGENRF